MIVEAGDGITLVGTAHVSKRSVEDVETTIRRLRPHKVLVELDERRFEALRDPEAWRNTDIIQILREKKQHLFLLQLYLASMQARFGRETGSEPGAEMLRAIEVADELGAQVVLIDRDISITLKRGFGAMGFWQRMGLGMNVLMETLPGAAPEEGPPVNAKRRTLIGTAAVLVLAALVNLTAIGARGFAGLHSVLDTVIGYPAVPVATLGWVGLALGLTAGSLVPRHEARDLWPWLQRVPWAGAALGILASWVWTFTSGFSRSFLAGLLPSAGTAAGTAFAGVVVVAAAWLGFKAVRGVQTFDDKRRAMATRTDVDIDSILEQDAITQMTEEFARFAPVVKTALIDERDAYMASHIRDEAGTGPIVAVVGAGHLPGIQRHLDHDLAVDREALDELPRRRFTVGKAVAYGIPLFVLGTFVYLGITGDSETLRDNVVYWVLINGTLSALGALLARGHILSVLTAFVASPLTSLSPALAAGWFAGLVEAKMHTPTVADFEAIKRIEKMKDFFRNGVVRVLMVTALANVGSSIGSWLGLAEIVRSLT